MSTTAIVLLVMGILFFIVSFFLPDGKTKEKEETQVIDEATIKKLVDKEVLAAKEKIEEIVDETVNYSVEKTERQLEKLSNEKIMAVDEYSETVLKKINDNHQEAVFLYDMLNDKDEKLKNNDEQLKALNEELKEKDRQLEVREEVLKAKDEVLKAKDDALKELEKENMQAFVPFVPERVEVIDETAASLAVADEEEKAKENAPKKEKTSKPRTVKKPVTGKTSKIPEIPEEKPVKTESINNDGNVELYFDRDNESKKNNNELIKKMHDEGKSNMAIAKELGLGVGEVKLVIDLFATKK